MNLRSIFNLKIFKTIHSTVKLIQQAIWSFLTEFCDNSNIHGVRYITARFLHWTERILWVILIAVCFWLCGTMISNIWKQWQLNPMKLSLAEKEMSIMAIPFPTVTICPEIKTDKAKFDLSKTLHKVQYSEKERVIMHSLTQICPRILDSHWFRGNFISNKIYKTLHSVALRLEKLVQFCSWSGHAAEYKACAAYFTTVITDEGICFSFNSLNSYDTYTDQIAPELSRLNKKPNISHWDLENGYKSIMTHEPYPLRVGFASPADSLILRMNLSRRDYEYKCKGIDQGFKVALTTPGEAIKMSRDSIRVPPLEKTMISIEPKLITTSDGLRSYKPSQRQCFYQHERRLYFYKLYTKTNCEEECLANYTKYACECVPFSMPRAPETEICGAFKIECYKKAIRTFRDHCNCLSACTSIQYNTEVNRIEMHMPPDEEKAMYSPVDLEIFYKNPKMDAIKRLPSNTLSDFLMICGHLFRFFMGISTLSIIELVYYCSVRWLRPFRCFAAMNYLVSNQSKWTNLILLKKSRSIRSYISDVCSKSSIHGVRYFTKPTLNWCEKCWWFISVGLSLWLCSMMIRNVWIHQGENVALINVNRDAPISVIPFPTLTICPKVKAVKRIFNVMEDFVKFEKENNWSDIDEGRLKTILQLCPRKLHKFRNSAPFMDESIYDMIEDMAPQFNDTFFKCWWKSEPVDCAEYFVPVFTDQGYCFSFNDLNSHEIYKDAMAPGMMNVKTNPNVLHWDLEMGYYSKISAEYPLRVHQSGDEKMLQITLLTNEEDFDHFCGGFEQVFRVFLSTPGDSLNGWNSLNVPVAEDTQILISPKLITTSDGLRRYTPHQRQCYYDFERPLIFFKEYTEQNCETECLALYLKYRCNCVRFSMPRDKNTTICGIQQMGCYKKKTLQFHNDRALFANDTCDCLPACTSIEYNAQIDRVKFNTTAANEVSGIGSGIHQTRLSIRLQDRVKIATRMELHTLVDFLMISGGILGIFMGFSALSLVELVYFCTFRWFCIMRRTRATNSVAPFDQI